MVYHHFFSTQNLAHKSNQYFRDMLNSGKYKLVQNRILVLLNYHSEKEYIEIGQIEGKWDHEKFHAFVQWFNEVTK